MFELIQVLVFIMFKNVFAIYCIFFYKHVIMLIVWTYLIRLQNFKNVTKFEYFYRKDKSDLSDSNVFRTNCNNKEPQNYAV